MRGMAPATAASYKRSTPELKAASAREAPWAAISSLLAVTTGLPAARAVSTSWRAGSRPPISSTTTSTPGSETSPLASPVRRSGGTPGRARATSPTATPTSSKRTPERAAMASPSFRRSETRAPPTFPAPRTATRTGSSARASGPATVSRAPSAPSPSRYRPWWSYPGESERRSCSGHDPLPVGTNRSQASRRTRSSSVSRRTTTRAAPSATNTTAGRGTLL